MSRTEEFGYPPTIEDILINGGSTPAATKEEVKATMKYRRVEIVPKREAAYAVVRPPDSDRANAFGYKVDPAEGAIFFRAGGDNKVRATEVGRRLQWKVCDLTAAVDYVGTAEVPATDAAALKKATSDAAAAKAEAKAAREQLARLEAELAEMRAKAAAPAGEDVEAADTEAPAKKTRTRAAK